MKKLKLVDLILTILVLISMLFALIERNTYSMICGCVLLLNLELEKIYHAIVESGAAKNECDNSVQKH